ncbi:MAG: IS66 family transposase, partial [Acetobacteraceae bacterium]
MTSPPDLDALTPAQLKELVIQLLGEVATLRQTVASQREEIARLKGLKGRPEIKPSGMEAATEPPKPPKSEKRRRGKVQPRVKVEDRVVPVTAPAGSRFKGHVTYLVQDLVLSVQAIRYQRERWLTPDGQTIVAPLPAGIAGHFGPELRRFVLMLYHQGQSTLPRLTALLQSLGVAISKREVQRLLTGNQGGFLAEAAEVLRAGLETASWISVDDTGARHKAANGFCTQIGNDRFTWFGTRPSKSRLNFLDLLRAGHTDFVLNDVAFGYMRDHALPATLIGRLAEQTQTAFAHQSAWNAHLDRLGFTGLTTTPNPVQIATEGALWGSVHAHGFLRDTVVLSDDAGQFAVGHHALCWVHAERLVHKLAAFTDHNRRAQQHVRTLIWDYYADLKTYRADPSKARRQALRARFDRIFRRRTGFVTLDRLLARLHANKTELLTVLERPETPLNTNGSENDIRSPVTRRKV